MRDQPARAARAEPAGAQTAEREKEEVVRAAIYARMSTDKQSADSPADQIARCRDFAASRGWQVSSRWSSRTRASPAPRATTAPGLLEADRAASTSGTCCSLGLVAARARQRGPRLDSQPAARAHARRLRGEHGPRPLQRRREGAGVMAEEYLVKLRADTHRGLRGRVGARALDRRPRLRLPHGGDRGGRQGGPSGAGCA